MSGAAWDLYVAAYVAAGCAVLGLAARVTRPRLAPAGRYGWRCTTVLADGTRCRVGGDDGIRAAAAEAAWRTHYLREHYVSEAPCRCGHPQAEHEHYRTGSDCASCRCSRYAAR